VFLIEIVKYNYIGYEITKFSFILTNNIFIYFKDKYLLAILLAAFFNLCISLGFNNEILNKISYTSLVLKAWIGILAFSTRKWQSGLGTKYCCKTKA